jgi:hypothetical protein
VNGPFSLAGLALLVVGVLMSQVFVRHAAGRWLALGMLGLGALTLTAAFVVALRQRPEVSGPTPVRATHSVRAVASGQGSTAISAGRDVQAARSE